MQAQGVLQYVLRIILTCKLTILRAVFMLLEIKIDLLYDSSVFLGVDNNPDVNFY
jgi:hypothetical protein